MKRTSIGWLIALSGFLLTACGQNGFYRLAWITDGEHVLDNHLEGDLVVLGGSVVLPPGSLLEGSLHLLSGNLQVAGDISGDVIFLGGDLLLEPGAHIYGDLNLGSNAYERLPGVIVDGQVISGTGVGLPDIPRQNSLSFWSTSLRVLFNAILLAICATLLTRYWSRGVQHVGHCAQKHSLVSGAFGLLVGIVGLSLLVTLAYTVLLIPVTLLGLLIMGLAIIYGWAALGIQAGRVILPALKIHLPQMQSVFVSGFIFAIFLDVIAWIPFVGSLMAIGLSLIGLGAVSLTRFGLHPFVPAVVNENSYLD